MSSVKCFSMLNGEVDNSRPPGQLDKMANYTDQSAAYMDQYSSESFQMIGCFENYC